MDGFALLVPLDGSEDAEQALKLAPALVPLGLTTARLLSVLDEDAPSQRPGALERQRDLVLGYLRGAARKAEAIAGLPVEIALRTGAPAAETAAEAAREDVGLVLMATRARRGLERWRLGSVTEEALRLAPCPVLVAGPGALPRSPRERIGTIVVPLDGSTAAEEALPVARLLAEKLGASLRLVRAVTVPSVPDDLTGGVLTQVVESAGEIAERYLSEARLELELRQPVAVVVLAGPAADALEDHLRREPPDLVVMTTHARAGLARWVLGSVTARLLGGPTPVLVVRPDPGQGERLFALVRRQAGGDEAGLGLP